MKINNSTTTKTTILSLLCLLLYLPVWAQQYPFRYDRVTVHDEDGRKYVFHVDKKNNVSAKTNRTYHWYSANRLQSTQGGYSGKLLDGNYTLYETDKTLAVQGGFRKGLRHGQWREWHPNGKLKKISQWRSGRENGPYALYDATGKVIEEGTLENGLRDGQVQQFVEEENSYRPVYYRSGQEITEEAYIQQSIFRRTGYFIRRTWANMFHKQPSPSLESPTAY